MGYIIPYKPYSRIVFPIILIILSIHVIIDTPFYGNLLKRSKSGGRFKKLFVDPHLDSRRASGRNNRVGPPSLSDITLPLATLLNKHDKCQHSPKMLIAIMANPLDKTRRNYIRKLWGHRTVLDPLNALILFFLGKAYSNELQKDILKESEVHNDIIQFDLMDTFHNLTLKSLSMMKWYNTHCTTTPWYVKTDIDSFWNIYLLNKILESKDISKTIYDYRNRFNDDSFALTGFKEHKIAKNSSIESVDSRAIRMICPRAAGLNVCRRFEKERCEERYIVTKEEYPQDQYPAHCHGFAYILHQDLVAEILAKDNELVRQGAARFRMEDVYVTGVLAGQNLTNIVDIS